MALNIDLLSCIPLHYSQIYYLFPVFIYYAKLSVYLAMAEGVDEANFRRMMIGDNAVVITPCRKPPSVESVRQWLEKNTSKRRDVIKTEPVDRDIGSKIPGKNVEKDHVSRSPLLKSQEWAAKNGKGVENTPEKGKNALMESPTLSPSFPASGTVTMTPSAQAHCTSTPLSIMKRASQRLRLPRQESDQKSKPNVRTMLLESASNSKIKIMARFKINSENL